MQTCHNGLYSGGSLENYAQHPHLQYLEYKWKCAKDNISDHHATCYPCILPIFLYGSNCWLISKTDVRNIDALDQWCLRMPISIKWYQFVRNDGVRRLTKQPKLTAIIQSCRLTLFGYIMRMDDKCRCQEDPVSLPSGRLEKTTRSSPHHMAQHLHHPTVSETPPYAPRSSRFGSEPPSVEDDVNALRYAILRFACQKRRWRPCYIPYRYIFGTSGVLPLWWWGTEIMSWPFSYFKHF